MREYLSRIGYSPQDLNELNIIHISGTKGKGSTCAFTSHIIAEHRHLLPGGRQKVGLYTSPHLQSVRERIQIDNKPIAKGLFAKYFWQVWDRLGRAAEEKGVDAVGGRARPVYFRYLTLLAFHTYLCERVGAVVLEVGIGGEYDSTNIVEKPIVTGLSVLAIDHVFVLGPTLPEIAWHKGGIFKPGAAAYSVVQPEEARAVLESRARERLVLDGVVKWVDPDEVLPGDTKLGLQGAFQRQNAALAVSVAAEALRVITCSNSSSDVQQNFVPKLPFLRDHGISPDNDDDGDDGDRRFRHALESTVWPGRCQVLPDKKLGGDTLEWCLDGAHTNDSLEVAWAWFAGRERERERETTPTTITPPPPPPPTTTITTTAHQTTQNNNKKRTRILLFNQQARDAVALVRALHHHIIITTTRQRPPAIFFFDHVLFTTNTTWRSGYKKLDLVSMGTAPGDVDTLAVQRALEKAWAELDAEQQQGGGGGGGGGGGAKRWLCASIEEAVELARALVCGRGSNNVERDEEKEVEGEVEVEVAGEREKDCGASGVVFCTGSLHLVGGVLEVLVGGGEEEEEE